MSNRGRAMIQKYSLDEISRGIDGHPPGVVPANPGGLPAKWAMDWIEDNPKFLGSVRDGLKPYVGVSYSVEVDPVSCTYTTRVWEPSSHVPSIAGDDQPKLTGDDLRDDIFRKMCR